MITPRHDKKRKETKKERRRGGMGRGGGGGALSEVIAVKLSLCLLSLTP